MKFATTFANPDTGEERQIVVELDDIHADPASDIFAAAHVLLRAYQVAPKEFAHVPNSIRREYLQ